MNADPRYLPARVPLPKQPGEGGVIDWMTRNGVTPNILMMVFLLGGLLAMTQITQEVFPQFDRDQVDISVSLPGSTPEEVEQGVLLPIEEAVRGINGIKEINSTAREGSGEVQVELHAGEDRQRVFQDIDQAVSRIRTLPQEAERPVVALSSRRREVLDLQLYGNISERALYHLAENVREQLLQHPDISQVDFRGMREPEVHIEVDADKLRAYGDRISLARIAEIVRESSIELGGGEIRTRGGKILLKVRERRQWAREFASVPIITAGNAVVTLGDIATIREGFEDSARETTYNGKRTIEIEVYRVGTETPTAVSDAVRAMMAEKVAATLPEGVEWGIERDRSEYYRDRLELLLKNAALGLCLVMLVLGLFLETRLAFWVTMGIPISFLGSMILLYFLGVTINMISMFAFIIALGIVVDDAIVVGENVFEERRRGRFNATRAAIVGTAGVAIPVSFAILSNVVTFLPIAYVPGTLGKIWFAIPVVVCSVFAISWIESLLILPAHLAHTKSDPKRRNPVLAATSNALEWFVARVYTPLLRSAVHWRFASIAAGIAALLVVAGLVWGGRIRQILMPRVESDSANVTAVLPVGTPVERARQVRDQLIRAARQVAEENGQQQLLRGIMADIEEHRVEVRADLQPPDVRPISTTKMSELWREATGTIVGLESLRFESDRGGPGGGAAITIELSHRNIATLERASESLAESLREFSNTSEVDDGYARGKQQFEVRMTPAGQSLGLTARAVASQIRHAFYGAEALREQRGREEVRFMVRLPQEARSSELDVDSLLMLTPAGTHVPLRQVASLERGRAFTEITRNDGRRTVTVTADVNPIGETQDVMNALTQSTLPQLLADYPGLTWRWSGRQSDRAESAGSLFGNFLFALLGIYVLLAIPLGSYTQPFVVMFAIPFGVVGAVIGHALMGYHLSLLSMMGIVALSGVVVNGTLVLTDYANRLQRDGMSAVEAIQEAGIRRFRPVLLTTLTTFGGLAPMLLETSRQARFLIPMAISLAFGIVFATLITLLLAPAFYLIHHDLMKRVFGREPFADHD